MIAVCIDVHLSVKSFDEANPAGCIGGKAVVDREVFRIHLGLPRAVAPATPPKEKAGTKMNQ